MTQGVEKKTCLTAEGDGPAVVLVHGLGLNHRMWDWQLPALTGHFRVVRYDLLGHGESPAPEAPVHMGRFVEQLAGVLDSLGIARCALVGFSLGGMIAQAFTLAHPAPVRALAILNSGHDRSEQERAAILCRVEQAAAAGPGATVGDALVRWFNPGFAARRPDIMDQIRQWILANDPAVYPAIYRLLAEGDRDLVAAIAKIACPTLTLACDGDLGNSPDMARRMAARIPGARSEIVPGLKHMGLVEDPAAISRVLLPFLRETLRA